MRRYTLQFVLIGAVCVNLALWLPHCGKTTVDPAKVKNVDSGAIVEVGIPDAATLADAVSPADAPSPVTP